jgi:hypothetical protein
MFQIYVLENVPLILTFVLFILINFFLFTEWHNYQTYIFKRAQLNALTEISLQCHYILLYSPKVFSKFRTISMEKQLQEMYIRIFS